MKLIKYLLTTIVIASVIAFLYVTDFSSVGLQLQNVGSGFILILVISAFSFLLGAWAWKYCFNRPQDVSLSKLFFARTIGEVIAFVNPTSIVAGEAAKIQLLAGENLSATDKSDSIFISRIVLISSQVFLALICFIWLSYANDALLEISLSMLGCMLLCVLAYRLLDVYFQNRTRSVESPIQRKMHFFKVQSLRFFNRLTRFVRNKRKQLCIAYFITTIHWFVGAFELLVILHLLGVDSSIFSTLSVDMGVILLKSAGSFVPGQIGIEELGNKWMLSMIGVNAIGVWISVSIIRRARQLFWISLSLMAYFIFFIKTKKNNNGHSVYNT